MIKDIVIRLSSYLNLILNDAIEIFWNFFYETFFIVSLIYLTMYALSRLDGKNTKIKVIKIFSILTILVTLPLYLSSVALRNLENPKRKIILYEIASSLLAAISLIGLHIDIGLFNVFQNFTTVFFENNIYFNRFFSILLIAIILNVFVKVYIINIMLKNYSLIEDNRHIDNESISKFQGLSIRIIIYFLVLSILLAISRLYMVTILNRLFESLGLGIILIVILVFSTSLGNLITSLDVSIYNSVTIVVGKLLTNGDISLNQYLIIIPLLVGLAGFYKIPLVLILIIRKELSLRELYGLSIKMMNSKILSTFSLCIIFTFLVYTLGVST